MKAATRISLAVLALLAIASSAFAAPGINMNWDDCTLGTPATDKTDPCNSNAGAPIKLVLSVAPDGVINNVNGAQGIVDIQIVDTTVPDYWHLETGGCRAGRLSADVNIGSASAPFSCLEPWSQVGNQAGGANFAFPPDKPANWGRITWIIAVPGEVSINTADGADQYIIALNITKANTTSCTGCATPACLVANEMRLTKPAQTPGGDVFITSPATSYHVTWQGGGAPACPGTTPTQNTTWGQVKHLYR